MDDTPASIAQHRLLSSTPSCSQAYRFPSNLTRPQKSKTLNRDNYERWRESGQDVRVGQDILEQAGRDRSKGRGRGGRDGRGAGLHAGEESALVQELNSIIDNCRDLTELQVVVKECGRQMTAAQAVVALGKVPRLVQATPSHASPKALATHICRQLLQHLEQRMDGVRVGPLARALNHAINCGAVPSGTLLQAVADRLKATDGAGVSNAQAAGAGAVSYMCNALSKVQAAMRAPRAPPLDAATQAALDAMWVTLLQAAHRLLLGALGEADPEEEERQANAAAAAAASGRPGEAVEDAWQQHEGDAAHKRRRERGERGEQGDGSMPQEALEAICRAVAMRRPAGGGDADGLSARVWDAAARLAARHADQIDTSVACNLLYSAALASRPSGELARPQAEELASALWGPLSQQLRTLPPVALVHLHTGACLLYPHPPGALLAVQRALSHVIPKMDAVAVTSLATSLARRFGHAMRHDGGAQPPPPEPHADAPPAPPPPEEVLVSVRVLVQLLSDLLVIRGPRQLELSRYASTALALALLGQHEARFWNTVEGALLPELPAAGAVALSRVLGAFAAACAAPSDAFLQAAQARLRVLLHVPADDGDAAEGRGRQEGDGDAGVAPQAPAAAAALPPLDGAFLLRNLAKLGCNDAALCRTVADLLLATDAGGGAAGVGGTGMPHALVGALQKLGLEGHGLYGRLQQDQQQ